MRAAVPRYVGEHFADCPPGHRFGLYFPVWKDDWSIAKEQKGDALKQILPLPRESIDQLNALRLRQALLLDAFPENARLTLVACSTAPFATGLGLEHPLENGFAFLNPYGLAYLPGSAVKGVLRRAAEELAGELSEADRKGWTQAAITVLFGLESEDRQKEHLRGALTFWDVIPEPAGNRLGMEVMTPHYSDYYQGKTTQCQKGASREIIAPHDAGQPNPIVFLVVPAESEFRFHLTCDTHRLPETLAATWQDLMRAAFEHACDWLGFGAKTAVGYGAMKPVGARAEASQTDTSADSAAAEPQAQAATPTELWQGARLKYNRANKSLMAEKENKSAIALPPNGEALLARLPAELRRKVEANQFVRANVHVCGMTLVSIEPLNN
ncbi:MAG: type III-B CRISPR module RAMP protein Cmr6 [Thiobacillaceae bacterium]|nr:type III-B CRISPR module RAMP protein Cmr6 [Thiobacillaceae bacterium]